MLAPRPSQPEQFRPFHGLWSLWDMLELKSREFVTALRLMTMVETVIGGHDDKEGLDAQVDKKTWANVVGPIKQLDSACAGLGAGVTQISIAELLEDKKLTFGQLREEVRQIRKTFDRELRRSKLFALSPDDAKFFDGALAMFGDKVTDAFPSTIPEIDEAGKCLAVGRAAATIYHLMRVVEIALRSLGPQLEIADPQPSWNTVIRKLDSETKKEPRDRKLTADYGFLEDISAEMHAVNRAWRRKAMHVDTTFSLDNARNIFNATTSLMQHLADGGLSEPSRGVLAQLALTRPSETPA